MTLQIAAINCTLKTSDKGASSTDLMLRQMLDTFAEHGASEAKMFRAADEDIKPGVTSDEGGGDAWPAIRQSILDSDILLLGTPIWLGQPSSVCKRVLERMDAFLSEQDDQGRMVSYGTVAVVAVVGNEDGAHHVSAELYQALSDVGFTIPANAVVYWVGEAMQGTDYKDLEKMPDKVRTTIDMAIRNSVHVARLLHDHPYPGAA